MAVEAAIMMPVLIFLTLGLLQYGWIYMKSEQIANAARHGARVGARIDATDPEVQLAVADLMTKAGIVSYPTPTISHGPIPGTTQDSLTVTVRVPFKNGPLDLLKIPFIPVPNNLQSSVTMAKESTGA